MRVLLQRVKQAAVTVDGDIAGKIDHGYLLLVGMGQEDADDNGAAMQSMLEKIINLRIWPDDAKPMNRSLLDVGGALLIVSQFTLHADVRKGRRPSFTDAAPPAEAESLYDRFVELAQATGVPTATGSFGAMMDVQLTNDGPVTIWLDSKELKMHS